MNLESIEFNIITNEAAVYSIYPRNRMLESLCQLPKLKNLECPAYFLIKWPETKPNLSFSSLVSLCTRCCDREDYINWSVILTETWPPGFLRTESAMLRSNGKTQLWQSDAIMPDMPLLLHLDCDIHTTEGYYRTVSTSPTVTTIPNNASAIIQLMFSNAKLLRQLKTAKFRHLHAELIPLLVNVEELTFYGEYIADSPLYYDDQDPEMEAMKYLESLPKLTKISATPMIVDGFDRYAMETHSHYLKGLVYSNTMSASCHPSKINDAGDGIEFVPQFRAKEIRCTQNSTFKSLAPLIAAHVTKLELVNANQLAFHHPIDGLLSIEFPNLHTLYIDGRWSSVGTVRMPKLKKLSLGEMTINVLRTFSSVTTVKVFVVKFNEKWLKGAVDGLLTTESSYSDLAFTLTLLQWKNLENLKVIALVTQNDISHHPVMDMLLGMLRTQNLLKLTAATGSRQIFPLVYKAIRNMPNLRRLQICSWDELLYIVDPLASMVRIQSYLRTCAHLDYAIFTRKFDDLKKLTTIASKFFAPGTMILQDPNSHSGNIRDDLDSSSSDDEDEAEEVPSHKRHIRYLRHPHWRHLFVLPICKK